MEFPGAIRPFRLHFLRCFAITADPTAFTASEILQKQLSGLSLVLVQWTLGAMSQAAISSVFR
jgi:hypothetical protein